MTNIKTYTAGIIAALGIAGAALLGAGTAAAATDGGPNTSQNEVPAPGHIITSPHFAPQHVDPAIGFRAGDSPAGTHRHHRR